MTVPRGGRQVCSLTSSLAVAHASPLTHAAPSLLLSLSHTHSRLPAFLRLSFPTPPSAACTQTRPRHHKNNMSEFHHELLEATGLLQVVLTAVMMRGGEIYPVAYRCP